jgi:hypothetical protein
MLALSSDPVGMGVPFARTVVLANVSQSLNERFNRIREATVIPDGELDVAFRIGFF